MAMTPEEKNRLEKLEQLVQSLLRVENVPFIENVNRRAVSGIRADGTSAPTTISIAVRNALDTGSTTVTAEADFKLKVILPTGEVLYIPAFTS